MNIEDIKKEFPTLDKNGPYLDSASSALTPKNVIEKIKSYYTKYSCNLHRGEYFASFGLEKEILDARKKCCKLINAFSEEEIVFTSGSTQSSNMIVSMVLGYLKKGDEVLITPHAHSSLFAPVYEIARMKKINVVVTNLTQKDEVDFSSLSKLITKKTKAIFFSHVTNLYGQEIPIKKINLILKKKQLKPFLILDAAQSIVHTKVDVRALKCDFLFFSGHKIYGPTGVGVLWGRRSLLQKMEPPIVGGGQIVNVNDLNNSSFVMKDIPYKFEAGTLPLASIMGLGEAISFQETIGIKQINNHINTLRDYALKVLRKVVGIKIHSTKKDMNVVFSIQGYAIHDIATHLAEKNISVRGGQHCAQLLSKYSKHPFNTIRVSFQIYNTKKDIDMLVLALVDGRKTSYLDGFIK